MPDLRNIAPRRHGGRRSTDDCLSELLVGLTLGGEGATGSRAAYAVGDSSRRRDSTQHPVWSTAHIASWRMSCVSVHSRSRVR